MGARGARDSVRPDLPKCCVFRSNSIVLQFSPNYFRGITIHGPHLQHFSENENISFHTTLFDLFFSQRFRHTSWLLPVDFHNFLNLLEFVRQTMNGEDPEHRGVNHICNIAPKDFESPPKCSTDIFASRRSSRCDFRAELETPTKPVTCGHTRSFQNIRRPLRVNDQINLPSVMYRRT